MENLPASFITKSGRKYSHTNSEIFVTTLISEDDHLTAGAWAACDRMEIVEFGLCRRGKIWIPAAKFDEFCKRKFDKRRIIF